MPALNKQTLINLLIDSPLREPIKINLIDIVNNTNDVDLPKTYSTISKELEIFQKATERRMKLAEETIAKLQPEADGPLAHKEDSSGTEAAQPSALPPLPPLPTPPVASSSQADSTTPMYNPTEPAGLAAPKLDLPPLPTPPAPMASEPMPAPALDSTPTAAPVAPAPVADTPLPPSPVSPTPTATDADEDALKEIQKELDALKASATDEAAPAAPPTPPQA